MCYPKTLRRLVLLLILSLSGLTLVLAQDTDAPLVVFLVRHAEKVDTSSDAALSERGRSRALALANALRNAKITYIHSTDFKRTRNTATPLAQRSNQDILIYDPTELQKLADKIKASAGTHLVVGHSNTTPALVKLLGGEPGSPIDEATEFDRLYIVTLQGQSKPHTLLLRY